MGKNKLLNSIDFIIGCLIGMGATFIAVPLSFRICLGETPLPIPWDYTLNELLNYSLIAGAIVLLISIIMVYRFPER